MTANSQGDNKEHDTLIEFLVEDLKETGELLRDTDRKLAFLIQIYAGAFVLIATLSANKIIRTLDLLRIPGLILLLVLIPFTLWLFTYALKSKETKVVYIHRMNFLRREMHYLLQNKHRNLAGYWTSSEVTSAAKEEKKPKRVGLDDLYPNALRGMSVVLGIALAFVLSRTVPGFGILNVDASWQFPLLIIGAIVLTVSIGLYTGKLAKDNMTSIRDQIARYEDSSEKEEKELLSTEKDQKNSGAYHQSKGQNGMKKQVASHD